MYTKGGKTTNWTLNQTRNLVKCDVINGCGRHCCEYCYNSVFMAPNKTWYKTTDGHLTFFHSLGMKYYGFSFYMRPKQSLTYICRMYCSCAYNLISDIDECFLDSTYMLNLRYFDSLVMWFMWNHFFVTTG